MERRLPGLDWQRRARRYRMRSPHRASRSEEEGHFMVSSETSENKVGSNRGYGSVRNGRADCEIWSEIAGFDPDGAASEASAGGLATTRSQIAQASIPS